MESSWKMCIRDSGQRTDHTAQDPVLVADRLPGQSGDPVARGLPVDDGAVIVVGGGEVPVELCIRDSRTSVPMIAGVIVMFILSMAIFLPMGA